MDNWPRLEWGKGKPLKYFKPLGKNIAYVLIDALYDGNTLNTQTLLIRVIGRP